MAFQRDRIVAPRSLRTRRETQPFHRQQKVARVEGRHAHGIVVYDRRTDDRDLAHRDDAPHELQRDDWRITCFVTDRRYRRRGVTQVALRAALAAIRRRGGGVVEATPIAAFHRDTTVARSLEMPVAGVGIVRASYGTFGNLAAPGTVSCSNTKGSKPLPSTGRPAS